MAGLPVGRRQQDDSCRGAETQRMKQVLGLAVALGAGFALCAARVPAQTRAETETPMEQDRYGGVTHLRSEEIGRASCRERV